jgi:hypothetical protein
MSVTAQNRHLARTINKYYIRAYIKNQGMMLSMTDFERLLFLYKTEGIECSGNCYTVIQACRMMGKEV